MSQLGHREIATQVTSTSNGARYKTKALTQQIKQNSCQKVSYFKNNEMQLFLWCLTEKVMFQETSRETWDVHWERENRRTELQDGGGRQGVKRGE